MNYTWATISHVGRIRDGNEDVVYPTEDGAGEGPLLVAVADGIGGAVGGEIASNVAMEAAIETEATPTERVTAANAAVRDRIDREPFLTGMGTTLTLAELDADGLVRFGHVGDSRAYVLRDGEMTRLTTDHSLVEELFAAGKITEAETRTHPQRHLITRSLGMTPDVPVDIIERQLEPGDRLLLCSDGLTGMIDDELVAELLGSKDTPEEAAWALVDASNEAGGIDNISVVVVEASS